MSEGRKRRRSRSTNEVERGFVPYTRPKSQRRRSYVRRAWQSFWFQVFHALGEARRQWRRSSQRRSSKRKYRKMKREMAAEVERAPEAIDVQEGGETQSRRRRSKRKRKWSATSLISTRKRRLNLRPLFWPALVLALGGGGVYGWQFYAARQQASALEHQIAELARQERWKEAADLGARLVALDGSKVEAKLAYADHYSRTASTKEEFKRASRLYQAALQLVDDDQLRLRSAEFLMAGEEFHNAEMQADQVLRRSSTNSEAWRIKALALIAQIVQGDPVSMTKTIDAAQRALRYDSGDTELALKLAGLYRREIPDMSAEDRRAAADEVLENVVRENPQNALAWLARYEHRRNSRHPEAQADLDQAIALAPDALPVLLAAGRNALDRGDYTKAAESFRQAIELSPNDVEPAMLAGDAQLAAGQFSEALSTWTALAEQSKPVPLLLQIRLTDARVRLGELEQARESLAEVGRTLESSASRLSVLEHAQVRSAVALVEARLKIAQGHPLEALAPLESARLAQQQASSAEINAVREQVETLRVLEQAYMSVGALDLAAAAAEEAAQLQPDAAEPHVHAGRLWLRIGQLDLAQPLMQAAAELAPNLADAWLGLAHCIEQSLLNGTPGVSRSDMTKVLARADEASPDPVQMTVLEAQLSLIDGKVDAARQRFDTLLRTSPSPRAQAARILALLALGEHAEADQALAAIPAEEANAQEIRGLPAFFSGRQPPPPGERAAQTNAAPGEAGSLREALALAARQRATGQTVAARATLDAARQQAPENLLVLGALGDVFLELDDFSAVDELVETLHRLEGEQGSWWRYLRARQLLRDRRQSSSSEEVFGEARRLLTELETLRPRWTHTLRLGGELRVADGQMSAALRYWAAAIRGGDDLSLLEFCEALEHRAMWDNAGELREAIWREFPSGENLYDGLVLAWVPESVEEVKEPFLIRALRQAARRGGGASPLVWLASYYAHAGNAQRAREAIRAAIERSPNDLDLWRRLLAFYRDQDDRKALGEFVSKMPLPESLPPVERELLLAEAHRLLGQTQAAHEAYHRALAADPSDLAVAEVVGLALRDSEPELARGLLERAAANPGSSFVVRRALAEELMAEGGRARWQQALRLIQRAGPRSSDVTPEELRFEAELLVQGGTPEHLAEAENRLKSLTAIQATPRDRLLLARVYERRGAVRAAQSQLAALVDESPEKTEYLVALAELLLRHNYLSDAQTWIARLEQLAPGDIDTIRLVAWSLHLADRDGEIVPLVEKRLPLASGAAADAEARLLTQRGEIYELCGLDEQAGPVFERAAGLDRRALRAWVVWLAKHVGAERAVDACTAQAGQLPDAPTVRALAEVLSARPDDDALWLRASDLFTRSQAAFESDFLTLSAIAEALSVREPSEPAAAIWERIAAANPSDPRAAEMLCRLSANDAGRLPQAIAWRDRVEAIEGSTATVLDLKALVLRAEGKVEEALAALKQSLEADPGFTLASLHLAELQLASDAMSDARAALERFRQSGARNEVLLPADRRALAKLDAALKR